MQFNDHQRELLALRTYMGKFGVPADPRRLSMETVVALHEMVNQGVIAKIDTIFYAPAMTFVDLYLLTMKGEKLVEEQGVSATNPGTPEADYGEGRNA